MDPLIGSRFDLHSPQVWGYLCSLARQGRIKAIIGPRKVREHGDLGYLSPNEAQLVANDTTLVLKQLALWKMSRQNQPPGTTTGFFLHSPRDPASYLGSGESIVFRTAATAAAVGG